MSTKELIKIRKYLFRTSNSVKIYNDRSTVPFYEIFKRLY